MTATITARAQVPPGAPNASAARAPPPPSTGGQSLTAAAVHAPPSAVGWPSRPAPHPPRRSRRGAALRAKEKGAMPSAGGRSRHVGNWRSRILFTAVTTRLLGRTRGGTGRAASPGHGPSSRGVGGRRRHSRSLGPPERNRKIWSLMASGEKWDAPYRSDSASIRSSTVHWLSATVRRSPSITAPRNVMFVM